ncbi:MAG: hypothetical protein RBS81_15045 [Tenuifilaceae bacterium]|jgi:hypothetical protein|nr:hypothetical protein [Tenuifilaceae bacterium]
MTKHNAELNNEAREAYLMLHNYNGSNKQEVIQSLGNFIIYLERLLSNISKNTPKVGFIYQWIFCTEVREKDLSNYYKANIFAAKESLKRITDVLIKQDISPVSKRMLIDFICDLKCHINYFDKSQNYNWLAINTNSHTSNTYQDLAHDIFYNGKPKEKEDEYFCLSSSTPFIIRQSIEYKIKRILGIDYIEILGKPHKTLAKTYFKAIKNNEAFYKIRDFDFETIEKIHSWTHVYIHGGYRAEPWITETALHYLSELFYSGRTSQEASFSSFAGIEVFESDVQELMKRTEIFIKREIDQNAVIIWRTKPEVAYIKGDKS